MAGEGALLFVAERSGALLLVATLLAFVLRPLPRAWAGAIVAILVALAAVVPIGGPTAVDFVFSMIGPLSAAGLLLVASQLVRHLTRRPLATSAAGLPALAAGVAILGLAFYPPAMGLGRLDPYALGYAGWAVPVVMMALAALAALLRAPAVIAWSALAAAMFLAGLSPSRNLWDCLLDPVGWFAALILLAEFTLQQWKRRRRAPPPKRETVL